MRIAKLGILGGEGVPNIALGAATDDLVSVCLLAPDRSVPLVRQTVDVLDACEAHLRAVGTSRERLLFVQVWLADMAMFAEFAEAWNGWIEGCEPPALSVVTGATARRDCLVEIRVYAAPAPVDAD